MGLFGKKPEPKPAPKPMPRPAAGVARPAAKARNNYIVITLDSCRYDSFMAAEPKNLIRIMGGQPVQRRWSYAMAELRLRLSDVDEG